MHIEEKNYPEFSLRLITGESPEEIPIADNSADYIRVELPTSLRNILEMTNKGYIYADRTLGVSINLKRNELDYQKMIRFDIKRESPLNSEIRTIAINSFPSDRRFHIRPLPDNEIAKSIIIDYVDKLSEVYACVHKDKIVGFIDIEPYGKLDSFIYLAAVEERYRAAGAAVSLYAYAIMKAKEKGSERICGRISSSNTAVMNLYAKLGGMYNDPMDIFVRKEA